MMSVYILLAGGLGNQLFQYAAALEYGAEEVVFLDFIENQRTDKSGNPDILSLTLKTPVRKHSMLKRNVLLRKYFLILLGSTAHPTSVRYKILSSFMGRMFTSYIVRVITGLKLEIVLENRLRSQTQKSNSKKSKFLVGYFQSRLNTLSIEADIHSVGLAKPSMDFQRTLADIEQGRIVGAHIRRGDYVGHPTFGLLSTSYFKNAFSEHCDNFDHVMIFSDSPIETSDFVPRELENLVRIVPSYFSGPEVLILMSRCGKLIMSNSSLSWWAGFIGQSIGNEAIAPKPWFKAELQSPDFYHSDWKCQRSLFQD
jgi:hypothetical protein